MDDFPIFLGLVEERRFASTSTESEVVVRTEFSLSELCYFTPSEFEDLSQILKKFLELDCVVFGSNID